MSARPFTESEFSFLCSHFSTAGKTRNVLLLKLGCGTGYRVSELLALRVCDAWTGADAAKELTIARRNLKGGRRAYHRSVRSRRVPLAEQVRDAIREHLLKIGADNLGRALFPRPRRGASPWTGAPSTAS